ncbi:tail fiber assembly protein [Escherichia fergusonii]|uniref:tail fiber assembly protein n=2 Tax=Escherichia fergusonii TaxID=564 RepID=UPI000E29844E|nr:tail fiber assembly protein [Escherichia fergusonii]AXM02787.1 tail fiber assembly protein [Escherichia fergusonii]EFL4511242.1 tail fiber assembly protein [Escherichia fergusonii]EFL4515631.1 tail fiber assembly protein [Escherichia fergusonii]QML21374.1 tail fiber assembly protein [Escherichia fergusonii]BES09218.1 tail fiber assembly protein [Escherichia fergusonii]
MTFRMSAEAQTIRVFNLLDASNEFIGESDAYIPPYTGLPANSTDIAPPDIPAGYAAVFNADEMKWHLIEDHRGKTVYETKTGAAIYISELGALPPDVTTISPTGNYQKWNGYAWVDDVDAERVALINEAESQKKELLRHASEIIATLQDAVDLDMATDEEKLRLNEWKKYRVLLNRIRPENAPDIEWPVIPVME